MEELKLYMFSEANDNEGETWHFFVLLTDTEFQYIDELIESTDLSDSYFLGDTVYEEDDARVLIKYGDQGYMPVYNWIGRPEGDLLKVDEEFAEVEWYKGGFRGV